MNRSSVSKSLANKGSISKSPFKKDSSGKSQLYARGMFGARLEEAPHPSGNFNLGISSRRKQVRAKLKKYGIFSILPSSRRALFTAITQLEAGQKINDVYKTVLKPNGIVPSKSLTNKLLAAERAGIVKANLRPFKR